MTKRKPLLIARPATVLATETLQFVRGGDGTTTTTTTSSSGLPTGKRSHEPIRF